MKVYKHTAYNYVTIVEVPKKEIEKIDFALCKQPTETLKNYYNRQEVKPDILSNGGFFNMSDGKTIFNYRDEGESKTAWHWHTTGMGVVNGELKYGDLSGEKWNDFITGYPPLIANGKALTIEYATELNYKARRTVLAYNTDTIFLLAIESPGMNFSQMQNVLLGLGVTYAINLDGGGSTKILQNGTSITSTSYNRAVDNVVAIYLKKEPVQKTIYRVQVGAFSKKANAEALLDKIKALPDTIGAGYKNAYVRQIGGLYKVQVGAFSKKENAQRVLDDLKKNGHNGFITTN